MALSRKRLSTICRTASHNVLAVVLAGEADLVENEGVLHRSSATCHGYERWRRWLRYLEGSWRYPQESGRQQQCLQSSALTMGSESCPTAFMLP